MTDNARAQRADFTEKVEKVVEMWNHVVPELQLSVAILFPINNQIRTVNTILMMEAILELLCKFGFDSEAIIKPPQEEERDEHTEYYWDLIPIINVVRILNNTLLRQQPYDKIKLLDLLNPSPVSAAHILSLLMNLAIFYTTRREEIEPREMELFQQEKEVAALEQERDDLLTQINEQTAAKGSRQMRLKKLDEDLRSAGDELKRQRQAREDSQRELDTILEENCSIRAQNDKRRLQKEALLAELARVKAQKVNDVDDIRAQHETAIRTEKEVTEHLDSLKETLCSKEAVVRNLQAVRTLLEEGIHHAQEINTLTNSLQEMQTAESRQEAEVEAALEAREASLSEAQATLDDAVSQREALAEQRNTDRELFRIAHEQAQRAAKEAETAARAAAEKAEEARKVIPDMETSLEKIKVEKGQLEHELDELKSDFQAKLSDYELLLLAQHKRVAKGLEEKLGKLARK